MPTVNPTLLNDLPLEILCKIFNAMSYTEHVPRLRRVCKKWNQSIQDLHVHYDYIFFKIL